MFSYLLFFGSLLFEMEKDLWKIMDFCCRLFNKTKQKVHFSKPDCSHSKNDQAFLEAWIRTLSNSQLHWLWDVRIVFSFWNGNAAIKVAKEPTYRKCVGIHLQVSFFWRAQIKRTDGCMRPRGAITLTAEEPLGLPVSQQHLSAQSCTDRESEVVRGEDGGQELTGRCV